MALFMSLDSIRKDMIGRTYQGRNGMEVDVVNVVRAAGGCQVHFRYQRCTYLLVCGLGKFKKRYPFKINYPVTLP